MSTIEEAVAIAERTFSESDISRSEVIASIRDIEQAGVPEVLDAFAVFYLAVLSVVHSGQESNDIEPIWNWLVTFSYAREAGEVFPDFTLKDGSRWVVSNHPIDLRLFFAASNGRRCGL